MAKKPSGNIYDITNSEGNQKMVRYIRSSLNRDNFFLKCSSEGSYRPSLTYVGVVFLT